MKASSTRSDLRKRNDLFTGRHVYILPGKVLASRGIRGESENMILYEHYGKENFDRRGRD
jgi:hypothetical protein